MGMIQIRNVPDDVHRKLKARAASEGMSLSDYLLREVRESAARPTLREWFDRLATLGPVNVSTEDIVEAIHAGREERDEQLWSSIRRSS